MMTNPFKDEPIRAELADPYVSPRQPPELPRRRTAAEIGEYLWRGFIILLVSVVFYFALVALWTIFTKKPNAIVGCTAGAEAIAVAIAF
jgi:hypothetical protein